MIDFSITEEQKLLIESIRKLCKKYPESYWKMIDTDDRHPWEFCKEYTEAGFRMMGVPEEYGGIKVDEVTKVLEWIELGRNGVNTLAANFTIASERYPLHLMQETPELRAAVERNIESGGPLFAIAITEPEAGSESKAITTTYVRKNGKIYLNGQKTFVTNGEVADYIYVIARNSTATDPKYSFSGFLVPGDAPGVVFAKINKIGMFGQTCNEMFLDNVELDETGLVGKEGNGFLQLMKGFENERYTVSAIVTGWATAAYEDALNYANTREQFGKTIGSFQLIQEKLVNMKVKLVNMRNFTLKTAWLVDKGKGDRTQAAMCKLYCVRSAFEICDDAMQIFGGLGYTKETRIERLWRNCRFFRIGGGTDEVMFHIAGRQLLSEADKATAK
jgi:alkylation response protein AidB-like acyl-CoA dehydrogenase